MRNTVFRAVEPECRNAERLREFSAGVVFDLDQAGSIHCLIRDMSAQGAQLRIGAGEPVTPGAYLISLKNRIAYQLHPVWRGPSLMGVRFESAQPIDSTLPECLDFLKEALIKAKLARGNCIATQGICTRDQQLLLAESYSSEG
ncbi:MAG TPA: hypothetical protein VFI23_06885 [Rhizomicrobium sp.]|nr:hypothetical protein [Rhizomicrobium sp.]